jgi:predicted permease
MSRLASIWNRLIGSTRREREAAELEEEMRFHHEMLEQEAVESGVAPSEAAYAAKRRLGNQTYLREESADMWRIQPVETIAQDVRYALRFLRRSPVFTTVAVLSLALGIGANSAVFTLINAVMVKALPVPDPDRLVILEPLRGTDNLQQSFPHPYFRELDSANTVFDGLFAISRETGIAAIDRGSGPIALPNGAALVSGKYFSTLRVRPAMGRLLGPADDVTRRGHPVVVVSHDFWRNSLGSDPNIVGASVRVNDVPMTIVGVAPEGFNGTQAGEKIDLYVPVLMAHVGLRAAEAPMLDERGDWWLYVMGRLKPGVTREQAQAELSLLFKRELLANPPFNRSNVNGMAQLQTARIVLSDGRSGLANLRRRFAKPLAVLAGMSAIVLLIACTNLASLLSARAAARRKEIAIRLSMGAARRRLLRQLLTESAILSAAGALAGAIIAYGGAHALVAIASRGRNPLQIAVSPDWRVIAFTTAVAIATALLFGIVPALQATRLELAPALRAGAAAGRGRGAIRLGKVLIATQVALSVLLVFGGSLFVRSLQRMYATDVGFNHENVTVLRMDPRRVGYRGAVLASFYSNVLERVREVPGVVAATSSSHVMFTGAQSGFGGTVDGYTPPSNEMADITRVITAEGYFEMMGIPLKSGRQLTAADRAGGGGPRFAVVNEAFVRAYVPSGQPLGKRFTGATRDQIGTTIVGVVADNKFRSFREPPPPIAYWTFASDTTFRGPAQALFVRVDPRIPNVVPAVRRAIASLDRNVEVTLVRSLDDQIAGSVSNEQIVATLSAFFGAFALILAMIGLYGLMAYAVTSRTREIGIRIALGAASDHVARSVMAEALGLVAIGLVVGIPAALAASKVGQALLYGMSSGDASTMLITAGLLTLVAALAASIPAWRAANIDPVGMLRSE